MTSRRSLRCIALVSAVMALAACSLSSNPFDPPGPTPSLGVTVPSAAPDTALVGLVTDYGQCDDAEAQVADLVRGWQTDVVVTAGDNTQGVDGCVPFTESVGDYYQDLIDDPRGPRFYPIVGNHDYEDAGAGIEAYAHYFDYLPHNADPKGRWYSLAVGPVTFFMLDNDTPKADLKAQQLWLKDALAAAPEDSWKVVMFHRPPFTSGPHDPFTPMNPSAGWLYQEWGADIVLNGHQHVFEDVIVDDLHYVTTGVGGKLLERECSVERTPGSQVCIEGVGAVRIRADPANFTLQHYLLDQPDQPDYEITLTK